MQAQTSVGSTQYLSGLTRETTIDDRLGSNILLPLFDQEEYNQTMAGTDVREDPTIEKTREYNKSYYGRRKQQNNSQGDPYDFVYNGLPKEHSVLKEQPPCVLFGEKKIQYGFLTFCCMKGKTTLQPLDIPPELYNLFTSQCQLGKMFRKNIRAYNTKFSFASIGVTLDKRYNSARDSGVYTFHVQGGIYLKIDQLVPRDGEPRYLQLYFYDAKSESDHRVELTTSVKDDQRVYNRLTTSEVASIWVEGNENITTYKRSIVMYVRSEYPMHIQPYFACHDPLSYLMFFPNDEAGWHKRIPREGVDIRELVDDDDNDGAEDDECTKLIYLKQPLFTNNILGVVVSHIYVIEFQKRGLPHAHFLLIMRPEDKLANPDHYEKVVCAKIPDPNKHPELHQLVLKHTIHDPCGHLNTQCPCMKGEPKKCHWHYPRQFQETMQQGYDSYPLYRWRDNGIEIDTNARQYLYKDIPKYYTWNKSKCKWNRQKIGKMRGRMVSANPEGEQFYLRVLLQHVKGPTGFDYLYSSLACCTLHFLWDDHYESLSEDYNLNCASVERVQNMVLTDISSILQSMGRSLSDFDLPNITMDVRSYAFGCRKVHEECSIVVQEEDKLARHSLNNDKKNAYDTIMRHVDADSLGVFFIYGPGGTGKTFLYKALLSIVHSRGLIALATTSSGDATNNMTGGKNCSLAI
ncbi:ATP-dependent DNA helicase PIF1-like protein [Tanacetum coccineum]